MNANQGDQTERNSRFFIVLADETRWSKDLDSDTFQPHAGTLLDSISGGVDSLRRHGHLKKADANSIKDRVGNDSANGDDRRFSSALRG
jgi:hypothetical protein